MADPGGNGRPDPDLLSSVFAALAPPLRMPPRDRAVVLLVDDDESGRYATSRLLRHAGFDVLEAATGAETMERARERPDLVVLDVGLPDIDGFELCSLLKADPATAHTPIVYLSARFPRVEDRIRGLEAGADAYLSQPVDPGELLATARALLRSWWAGRALAESEARFRAVQEASPTGFALMHTVRDGEGRIVDFLYAYLNPAGERIMRRRAAEVVGRRMLDIHPVEIGSEFVEWYRRVMETGEPDEMEIAFGAQGSRRWFRVTVARVENGVAASFIDVTAQKETEAEEERLVRELTHERERLQSIFTQAPALISVTRGPDHVVELANPPFARMTGRRDIVGRPLREGFPEMVERGFTGLLDQAYQSGTPATGSEVPSQVDRDEDGIAEDRYYNFVFQPLFDSSGGVTGVMIFAVDVTEQVRSREEVERKAEALGRLTRALEASNRELDQYASVISHDLKAPLRAIANYASYLEQELAGQLRGETRLYLERLRNRVDRLQAMIGGVLAYSRAGRDPVQPERIDVERMVRGIVELLDPPRGTRVDVDPQLPAVLAERAPLEQVLRNLLDNAVKHSRRPDPRVRVSVRDVGSAYAFAVEDNGPGVPPQVQDRIWTLFHTLGEEEGEPGGTGIGLAIVKKLVEVRGGRVWVQSGAAGGATFHFVWPKRAQAAA